VSRTATILSFPSFIHSRVEAPGYISMTTLPSFFRNGFLEISSSSSSVSDAQSLRLQVSDTDWIYLL
jgi:hypothetical protein